MDRDVWANTPTTNLYNEPAFRYSNYDTPFWARNNTMSGRWHVPGDGATQYLSLHPDAAWADLARREGLRTDDELAFVRMQMWALTLSQGNLVDYSTFARAEAAGFAPEALVDDDHTRCQVEGQRLREAGFAGVLTPSAALPGSVNVTIFGRRMRSSWGVPTRLASSVPCCIVAVGSPSPGLASRVRHIGDAHAGYEDYADKFAEDVRVRRLDEQDDSARPDDDARLQATDDESDEGGDAAERYGSE